jgi:hypothetical protein
VDSRVLRTIGDPTILHGVRALGYGGVLGVAAMARGMLDAQFQGINCMGAYRVPS